MPTTDSEVTDLALPVLTDQEVLERVRSQADQASPTGRSLLLTFLSCDGTQLPAVVAIDDVPDRPDPDLVVNLCHIIASVLADAAPCGSVVITLSRPGPFTDGDADRYWAKSIRDATRATAVPVRMMCLAAASGVRQLSLDATVGAATIARAG
jgi:hypothetical protein